MLKLEEYSGGYYVLTMEISGLEVKRVFMDADKPLEEVEGLQRVADGLKIAMPLPGEK